MRARVYQIREFEILKELKASWELRFQEKINVKGYLSGYVQ
jgi:hypothetical protein